jgi:Asp-tRNA(Asn)/Glu-tRNA(Gln) amidotransferase A subunit family amidase
VNETDVCFLSAAEMAEAVAAKRLSPVEIVEAVSRRIEHVNPRLNAYCHLRLDQARDEARAAEAAVARGGALGPLHGVPISVKDMEDVAGTPNTLGSKAMAGNVSAVDAPMVERLRRAGAIVLGKTNTAEFGHKGVAENPLFGISRNPWDLARTPGGSSGGAAAAVAAGLGPIGVGNDGAGSIRIPASLCGVYGIKPSYGRIPQTILPNRFLTFPCTGPITRTVRDAAIALRVSAGSDDRDPLSIAAAPEDYVAVLGNGLRGARIGFSPDLGLGVPDREVATAFDSSLDALRELGADVRPVEIDCAPYQDSEWVIWRALYSGLADLLDLDRWRSELTPELAEIVEQGQSLTAREYLRAQLQWSAFYETMRVFFETHDFLVTPTLRCAAFEVGRLGPGGPEAGHPILGWFLTYPFNLTGHPAASVPCGLTAGRLPVGLQIVGRRHADADVLRASAAFERARPWATRRPDL